MNPTRELLALVEQLQAAFDELVARCVYWWEPVGSQYDRILPDAVGPVYRIHAEPKENAMRDLRLARNRFYQAVQRGREQLPALCLRIHEQARHMAGSEIDRHVNAVADLMDGLGREVRAISTAHPSRGGNITDEVYRDPAEEAEGATARINEVLRGLCGLEIHARPPAPPDDRKPAPDVPTWDGEAFELGFRGWTKRYRRNASSQVHVLETFEAMKWRRSISSGDLKGLVGKGEFKNVVNHLNESIGEDAPLRFARGGLGILWSIVGE